jgi:flagellar basal-body rod protein FlgC
MISALSSAVSAISALDKKMAVVSNNIANSQTDGFKKSRADLKEGGAGAVEVDIRVVDTPGPIVSVEENGGIVEKEMSNVDLAEELPQTILAQTGFEANLKMLKTEDEMMGTLLDIFG